MHFCRRTLPSVLASSRDASGNVTELRPTSHDLRGLHPDLDRMLHNAPDTLRRVPDTAHDVIHMSPQGQDDFVDLNPTLGYVEPYAMDIGGTLTNFASTLMRGDNNDDHFTTYVAVNQNSATGLPVSTHIGPLSAYMPYVRPGEAFNPHGGGGRPFTRLQKDSPGR